MKLSLWAVELLLLVSVLALGVYLLRGRIPNIHTLSSTDALSFFSLLVNVVVVLFTALSVFIALAAFNESRVSGEQHRTAYTGFWEQHEHQKNICTD
jgi:hypothetical protein